MRLLLKLKIWWRHLQFCSHQFVVPFRTSAGDLGLQCASCLRAPIYPQTLLNSIRYIRP